MGSLTACAFDWRSGCRNRQLRIPRTAETSTSVLAGRQGRLDRRQIFLVVFSVLSVLVGLTGYVFGEWWLVPPAVAFVTNPSGPWWGFAIDCVFIVDLLVAPTIVLVAARGIGRRSDRWSERFYFTRLFMWFGILAGLVGPVAWVCLVLIYAASR